MNAQSAYLNCSGTLQVVLFAAKNPFAAKSPNLPRLQTGGRIFSKVENRGG